MDKHYKHNFKQFFNLYYEELVIYAENYLFKREDSEDVVQEVFIHLWENSDKININTSARAYLYSMVRNKCINYLRKVKITDNLGVLEWMAILDESFQDEGIAEEKKEKYESIMGIVNQMPVKMQEVFKMKYVDNYKYTEISSKLGISLNTVRTHLLRAKQKISEALLIVLCLYIK